MFFESFAVTAAAVGQISLLALLGFFLVKRNILGSPCLVTLSNLTLDVCLPALVFYELIGRFDPGQFPGWWMMPFLSFTVTLAGLAAGAAVSLLLKAPQERSQCAALTAFQNSGYLPLALIASLVPHQQAEVLFIYLFLFLAGFNFAMFSLGVFLLTRDKSAQASWGNVLNPPVVVTLASVLLVLLGAQRFVPEFVLKPAKMVGDCTLPLAMFVVGGSLAEIPLFKVRWKPVLLATAAKMLIVPVLGVAAVKLLRVPHPLGLLIVLQCAMPSAMSLSAILKKYDQPDLAVSHGIFVSHLVSVVTLPLFLGIYFSWAMVQ
jgi:malate permease and related proteins